MQWGDIPIHGIAISMLCHLVLSVAVTSSMRLPQAQLLLCLEVGIFTLERHRVEGSPTDLKALLHRFGHTAFRPGQEQVISTVLRGRDVLALLPTGAGKSLAYQLTAQLLPGITVVVSPLIALMQDQVRSLVEQGFEVTFINSTLTDTQAKEELNKLRTTASKLLYITPERFNNQRFMAYMRRASVSLFVVDEAHCISEWGHSFRPSYLALPDAIEKLGRPVVLALTATATSWMRIEIIDRLRMRDPAVVVRGIDRPNLFFEVQRVEAEDEDRRVLQRLLFDENNQSPPEIAQQLTNAMQGSGIIYTATTAAARTTAGWLRQWGIAADYYHGQRKKSDRVRVQDTFMSGELQVIVATNAFGLGVDKPDLRFVIHRDIPGSLEAYYQEAGRAGRDGEFACCVLIYRPGDLGRAAFLTAGGYLTRDEVRQAWPGLLAHPHATKTELTEATGLSKADLTRLLEILKHEKVIVERRGHIQLLKADFDPDMLSLEAEERRREYERSRLEMMRTYAETTRCRRRLLLTYFGDEPEFQECGYCDNDIQADSEQRIEVAPHQTSTTSFSVGDEVTHAAWGAGIVQEANGEMITVLFEQAGYKTLATDVTEERQLLKKTI
jgi:ATP-dependent DNA helicase RecQ